MCLCWVMETGQVTQVLEVIICDGDGHISDLSIFLSPIICSCSLIIFNVDQCLQNPPKSSDSGYLCCALNFQEMNFLIFNIWVRSCDICVSVSISLSITISSYIDLGTNNTVRFILCLNGVQLCICTLLIYSLTHLDCLISLMLWIIQQWIWICKYIFDFPMILSDYWGKDISSYMIWPLASWNISLMIHRMLDPVVMQWNIKKRMNVWSMEITLLFTLLTRRRWRVPQNTHLGF